jgi:ferric-dicitrate binding protein FerR (iron transport regulator)
MTGKDKIDIDVILARYFANEASAETIVQLQKWLAEGEENRRKFELLKAIWSERSAEPRSISTPNQETLDKIWNKGIEKSKRDKGFYSIFFFNYLSQIAAAFLIALIIPIAVYWINIKNQAPHIQPEITYVVKENPATQRSRFEWPDGSMVWLNCKSSLRFPENFSTSHRQVELSGEAFFEVKEDSLRPFVVSSGGISTTALGTSFNVAAYPERSFIEVALITGKVKIEDKHLKSELAVLNPGAGISYNKINNSLTTKAINPEHIQAWKSGVLIFDGDNYEDFVWKIKQWYDVDITTIGNVPGNWKIRGRFDNAYLTSILDVISFNKEFNYQLKDKQLTLRFNQKK